MKKPNRRNQKPKSIFPAAAKGRWTPNDTTRPITFSDKRKAASKKACRGRAGVEWG